MSIFPICIITTLQDTHNIKHIIREIRSNEIFVSLSQFGFSPLQLVKIQENMLLDPEHIQKKIVFSHISDKYDTVTCFFPGKSLIDDRSELFSELKHASVFIPDGDEVDALEAMTLATYKFEQYLSKPENISHALLISSQNIDFIQKKIDMLQSIIWARNIINTPPQDSNPKKIVEIIQSHSWKHFTVEVFDKLELQKIGCNLLLAVGAGSDFPPYMLIIKPKNPPKGEKYGLVGKGVTFDAGGIQIKPDTAMLDMKCDMSGAAGVVGVAMYLDTLDTLPINVTIAIGLTENMTGGSAYKPLDIYTSYNSTTVEIHHTDAEGRLVLADVMSYVEKNYHIDHLITMATLTGACLYALGNDIAGIMGDDEMVIQGLINSGSPYEKLWRLPMNEKFKKSLKADIADIKNIAKSEKAGSSIGGAFLSYFQGNAKFTHLDIAGPAYRETTHGYMTKGGTGWGVKILSEFLIQQGNIL